jgi:flagella basal body P-ring formation protein FlgA
MAGAVSATAAVGLGAATDDTSAAIAAAVEAAARAPFGDGAVVEIGALSGVRLEGPAEGLTAIAVPAARIGQPSRFLLERRSRNGRVERAGEVTATVRVATTVVRLVKSVGRAHRLAPDTLEPVELVLEGRPFRALPSLVACIGARVRRDLPAGAVVTTQDIVPEPLVRSGRPVEARVTVDAVTVTAILQAAENGIEGDVIRVVNEETRRVLRARVTGPGEVEVLDGR